MKYRNVRFLSLLVCVVLVCFSLNCSASASVGFTDYYSIGDKYAEAVDYMTQIGVLAGYDDGAFHPADTLTREQAAKIITYILLGADKANALRSGGSVFTDVAQDRWSAPCISWCAEREIIAGYGDGRYGPTDMLTGIQFSKMLLCALDLGREGSYIGLGDTWSDAVREDGTAVGLYVGDESMATDAPLERQQAALLAYHAICAAEQKDEADIAPAQNTEPPVQNTEPDDTQTVSVPDFPAPPQGDERPIDIQPVVPNEPIQPQIKDSDVDLPEDPIL